MNCKLLASELLCAALLLGCSTAPKLTLPSGDWEEVSQPGATSFSGSNPLGVASRPPSAISQEKPSLGQMPKAAITAPVPGSSVALVGPQTAASTKLPAGAVSPAQVPTPPIAPAVNQKAVVVPSVAPTKDFSPPAKAPVPAAVAVGADVKPVLPPPKVAPPPKPVWTATVGQSLRAVIKSWSDRANYTLDWRADTLDYPIDAPLRFEGTYEEAVSSIFELYEQADRSFKVDGRPPQHRLTVSEDHDKQKRGSQ